MASTDQEIQLFQETLIQAYQGENYQKVIDLALSNSHYVDDQSITLSIIASANLKLDRYEDAISSYKKALRVDGHNCNIHNNLGVVYLRIQKLDQAYACFQKAISLNPQYAEAYYNRGNLDRMLEDDENAIISYKHALDLEPTHFDAKNNLGALLQKRGSYEKAESVFREIVKADPHYALGLNNLGIISRKLGNYEEAMLYFVKAVSCEPENISIWENLASVLSLRDLNFQDYDDTLADIFVELLNKKKTNNPNMVAPAILKLLFKSPDMLRSVKILADSRLSMESFKEEIDNLSRFSLLLALMRLTPIADPQLERVFVNCRKTLLLEPELITTDSSELFLQALAQQCAVNEYIYPISKQEDLSIQHLNRVVEDSLERKSSIEDRVILTLACYKNLYAIRYKERIEKSVLTNDIVEFQISQVARQKKISKDIPSLSVIRDQVSNRVRQQYEENSYPRWINTVTFTESLTVSQLLKDLGLKNAEEIRIDRPKILIAGCGTGRHAVLTSSRFTGSRVTAFDLSINSVGYAKLKSQEFGINGIRYMHGDLLNIGELGEKFDIVESVGVLHHMDKPIEGLIALKEVLKTGGLMRLALYSESARAGVIQARKLIETKYSKGSIEDRIRSFRQGIINGDNIAEQNLKYVTKWGDFYSMSECRDLFFHEKEHRFTIPKIKEMLVQFDLMFLGFEFNHGEILKKFLNKYSDSSLYSLDKWHQFELANPDTFIGMYQFWVRKMG